MKIRRSAETDRAAIEGIHRSAIGQDQGEEIVELVNDLFDDETAKPLLSLVAESGVDLVFVLGHPGYYPKFGFQTAGLVGLHAPHPIPSEHADAWMVQALKAGVIGSIAGTVQCSEVLNQPRHWRE